jgi:hypothetical protein
MRRPLSTATCLACVVSAASCGGDAAAQFARTVNRAASWAAAVSFAEQSAQQGGVPHTYMHDLLTTAADDLASIAKQLDADTDVPGPDRARAANACRQLRATLADADRAGSVPDLAVVRRLELALRDAARPRRGADAPHAS